MGVHVLHDSTAYMSIYSNIQFMIKIENFFFSLQFDDLDQDISK